MRPACPLGVRDDPQEEARQTAGMSDQENTPETTTASVPDEDGQGAALDRAAEAIQEAKDAGGRVAANDDITAVDAQRAGDAAPDPEADGGHV